MKSLVIFFAAVAVTHGYYTGEELFSQEDLLPLARQVRQGYGSPSRPNYQQPLPPTRPQYGGNSGGYGNNGGISFGGGGGYGNSNQGYNRPGTGGGYGNNQGYNRPGTGYGGGGNYGGGGSYGGGGQPIPHPVTGNLPKPSPGLYSGGSGGYGAGGGSYGGGGQPIPHPVTGNLPVASPSYSASTQEISIAPAPAVYKSPSKQQTGGLGYNDSPVDSYSAPPQIQPGYGVEVDQLPTGPVGYGR